MSPRSHFLYFLAGAALLTGTADRAAAQSNASVETRSTPAAHGRWSVVMLSRVKPEARQQWDDYQKEISAAYKKAGVPSRIVLSTVFGDLTEYVSVTPLKQLSDMDGPGPVERALGKEASEALLARGRSMSAGMTRYAVLTQDEFGIHTPGPPPNFVMLSHFAVTPGRSSDFENWFKDEYLPVMRKGEVKNIWMSQSVFGANPNERIVVRLMEKLGEFDSGPVATRVLGQEGSRKLMNKLAGVVNSVRYEVLRFRPDLSYENAAAPAKAESASR